MKKDKKEYSGVSMVQLFIKQPEYAEALRKIAKDESRTISGQVRHYVIQGIKANLSKMDK